MGKKNKRRAPPEAAAAAVPSSPMRSTLKLPTFLPVLPPTSAESWGAAAARPLTSEVAVLAADAVSASIVAAGPALTDEECEAWIAWGEAEGFALEKHAASAFVAARDNGRLAVQSQEIADAIFARLKPTLPVVAGREAVGCNPNVRLYRYGPTQRFGRHVDGAQSLTDGSTTEFTVLFYLNDAGLEGGATVFYRSHESGAGELLRFAPKRGAALLHAHGERCLTHEGAAVSRGVKYLLRTDVAYSPLF